MPKASRQQTARKKALEGKVERNKKRKIESINNLKRECE